MSGPRRVAQRHVFLLALLLCFVPVATGQTEPGLDMTIALEPHAAPIPMGSSANITALVVVTCQNPAVFTEPVELMFSAAAAEAWMRVQAEPASAQVAFGPEECLLERVSRSVAVALIVTPELGAPAFRPAQLTFTVMQGGSPATVTWEEQVLMEGDFRVRFSEVYAEGDGTGAIRGTAINNANGPIVLRFTALEGPDRGGLELPDGLVVPSRATDGNDSTSFEWLLVQDGRGPARMTVRVEATAQANATHEVPPGYDVRILAEPRAGRVQWTTDPDEALQAPGAGAVLVLLVVALLTARARRRLPGRAGRPT